MDPDSTATTRRISLRSPWAAALLLMTVVLLASNHRLVTGEAVPLWDAAAFSAPAQSLLADHARAGKILLWNPWLSGGRPDCADPHTGSFSPINVALGLVAGSGVGGFRVFWLFIWWLGGLGILCLARHIGAPAWGAFLGAVAYVSTGFYLNHAVHPPFLVVTSLLPFVVWRLDVALGTRSKLAAAQAGAAWGLAALAGYPGLIISAILFFGLWTSGRILVSEAPAGSAEPRLRRSMRHRLAGAAAVWAMFLLIGGIVLAPTYVAFFSEGRTFTYRVEPLSKEMAVGLDALHPGAVATFASPYLSTAKLINPRLWPYTTASMTSIYISAAVLALALSALSRRPADRWRWWLAGCAVFFLFAAMGRALPLRGWMYDLLIPMRYFRYPALLRAFYVFSVITLALVSTRDLAKATGSAAKRGWSRLSSIALVLGLLAVFSISVVTFRVENAGRLFAAALIAAGLFFGTSLIARLGASRGDARRLVAPGLLALCCACDAAGSIAMSRWLLQSEDKDPWRRASAACSSELSLTARGLERTKMSRFADGRHNINLLSKEPALVSKDPFRNRFMDRWILSAVLAAAVTGEDRIWFADRPAEIEPTEELFDLFERRAEALNVPPLVLHRGAGTVDGAGAGGEAAKAIAGLEAMERAAIEIHAYEPNELSFSYTAPRDGWLFVSDRYAPGWRAWIDDVKVKVRMANFLFRAVEVRKGAHRITFRYRPWGHPWLLIASWSVLAGVGMLSMRTRPSSG